MKKTKNLLIISL